MKYLLINLLAQFLLNPACLFNQEQRKGEINRKSGWKYKIISEGESAAIDFTHFITKNMAAVTAGCGSDKKKNERIFLLKEEYTTCLIPEVSSPEEHLANLIVLMVMKEQIKFLVYKDSATRLPGEKAKEQLESWLRKGLGDSVWEKIRAAIWNYTLMRIGDQVVKAISDNQNKTIPEPSERFSGLRARSSTTALYLAYLAHLNIRSFQAGILDIVTQSGLTQAQAESVINTLPQSFTNHTKLFLRSVLSFISSGV